MPADYSSKRVMRAEIGLKPEVQEDALEDDNRALGELKAKRIRGSKILRVV